MTTLAVIIFLLFVMAIAFFNGVVFCAACENFDNDEDVPPFYKRWLKTLRENNSTAAGKILMASFYFIVSGIAICSYLISLIRFKSKKEQ